MGEKLYVVTEEYCVGLYGVFSTRKKAEEYIKSTNNAWGLLEIHEVTPDIPTKG